jgi:hypothetical protein
MELSQLAVDLLILRGTIYLCEENFPAVAAIKSKHQ